MSESSTRRWGLVPLVALAAGVVWLLWPAAPEPPDSVPPESRATKWGSVKAPPKRTPAPRALPETERTPATALEALDLDGSALVCATTLTDGLYEATPDRGELRFITVKGGALHAQALRDSGELWLAQELQQMGRLRWEDGQCEFEQLQLVEVSGWVEPPSAADWELSVTGCRFGEVAQVASDGSWRLEAALGSTCQLLVVAESGEKWGRGPVLALDVDGPVEEVELTPPAELWGVAQQRALALELARMTELQLQERQGRSRPELEGQGPYPQAWANQEDWRQDDMARQIDLLQDPESGPGALRDSMLGLY